MPDFTLQKLKKMYEQGKQCDSKIFAEQRTNVLLRSGQHYNKKSSPAGSYRSKDEKKSSQKIRITKNHIHRITNIYSDNILSGNPDVVAHPYNEAELSDRKSAEMHQAVVDNVQDSNRWKKKRLKHVNDFVVLGETFAKVTFDYDNGPVTGTNEETGAPTRLGEVIIDRVFGFDIKRDPQARDFSEARWLIQESMVDKEEFEALIKAIRPKDIDKISPGSKNVTRIFDTNTGGYKNVKDQYFIRELYVRPSHTIPYGFYVLFTDELKVIEQELPFGIWPWAYAGFDEQTTSARASSIIRVCRPYQVEINRSSSKMAEHQITLGDDKVFIQSGTKISSGGNMAGVRAIKVNGPPPTVQPGRSGAQYLDYGIQQIKEMYEACNLSFIMDDKQTQGDPYALLFKSMNDKKRFAKYADKYNQFEVDVFGIAMKVAKKYLTPEHIIKINGREEMVNVPEFQRTDNTGFEFKLIAQSGDIEEKFGKVLAITQTLQYAGSSLQPDQLGNLIKQLPYGNQKAAFSTLTVDQDNIENDILALDRGEQRPAGFNDNHEFVMKGLDHRMKKGDFRFLDQQIQANYFEKLKQHQMQFAAQQEIARRAQLGLIPSGGFLTTINASWLNPATQRVERIKVPSDAIQWLVSKLNEQGTFSTSLDALPPQSQQAINASLAPKDDVQSLPQIGQSDNRAASS